MVFFETLQDYNTPVICMSFNWYKTPSIEFLFLKGYVNHWYQSPTSLNAHWHGFIELVPGQFTEQIPQIPRIYHVILPGVCVEGISGYVTNRLSQLLEFLKESSSWTSLSIWYEVIFGIELVSKMCGCCIQWFPFQDHSNGWPRPLFGQGNGKLYTKNYKFYPNLRKMLFFTPPSPTHQENSLIAASASSFDRSWLRPYLLFLKLNDFLTEMYWGNIRITYLFLRLQFSSFIFYNSEMVRIKLMWSNDLHQPWNLIPCEMHSDQWML